MTFEASGNPSSRQESGPVVSSVVGPALSVSDVNQLHGAIFALEVFAMICGVCFWECIARPLIVWIWQRFFEERTWLWTLRAIRRSPKMRKSVREYRRDLRMKRRLA